MTATAQIPALLDEARAQLRKTLAQLDAPCSHTGHSPCRCQAEIREDITWWTKRIDDLEAC